jgi:hypothetical protein
MNSKRDLKLALPEYELTPAELDEFLNGEPRFATIASLRKSGAPMIDGIGYEWDGEYAYFSVRDTRALKKRLGRDARVCLHIMNTHYPVQWVRIEGVAEPTQDPDYERTIRIMSKYMAGDSPAQHLEEVNLGEYTQAYVEFGRTLYRLKPSELRSHDARKQAARYDLGSGRLLERSDTA